MLIILSVSQMVFLWVTAGVRDLGDHSWALVKVLIILSIFLRQMGHSGFLDFVFLAQV